jgi:hypothetical protein
MGGNSNIKSDLATGKLLWTQHMLLRHFKKSAKKRG